MIYECNFITNIRYMRQAPASKPISRHTVTHLGQLPLRKLSKMTAGLSKLSKPPRFGGLLGSSGLEALG